MDMDFAFPVTSTTKTTPEPPAVFVPGSLPAAAAAAGRQLPFFRFEAASSPSWAPPPRRSHPSPPPAAATAAPAPVTAMAAAAQQGPPPGAGGDAAAAEVEEDRMDLLWEDFNEELLARGRGGSCRRARSTGAGGLQQQARELWSSESSEAESEPAAARGCAPVLRPSSRVRHCRRRAGTWVLLMRIFRRLFVIEKTANSAAAAARRQHHAAAAATRAR